MWDCYVGRLIFSISAFYSSSNPLPLHNHHIVLASISLPNHSPQARVRVFEELPKRTNRLGVSTASWTKCLARRTAMGNYVNVEIITHCILLAQEAFRDGDFQVAMVFLNCVKMAVGIFPILGGNKECFGTLVELFSECRGSRTAELKKEIEKSGIVTVLSGILAAAASARSVRINKVNEKFFSFHFVYSMKVTN